MHPYLSPLSLASLAAALDGGAAQESDRPPLIAGVLSGTSADGIDVVLARVKTAPGSDAPQRRLVGIEAVAFATEPFSADLERRVRAVLDGEPLGVGNSGLGELAALDRDLGLAFGAAARRVADRHDLGELALVASHGQTVFHHDGDPAWGKITLQIGDGDFVAEAAGVPVVSDFRTRDCAAGGEGAPLVGLVDDVLFSQSPRPLAILNLGGISNWTILPGAQAAPVAFDAGPAGALLDGLSRRLLDAPCDRGGSAALAGVADKKLIAEWLLHPYFQLKGPRSTGRDTFGEAYVEQVLTSFGVNSGPGGNPAGSPRAPDVLATACGFVAEAAARALASEFPGGMDRLHVLVAGGGIHNLALMAALESAVEREMGALGVKIAGFGPSDGAGIPPDGREAMAFAALGARFLLGEPSTSTEATGAASGRILGKWSPGPVLPRGGS